MVHYHPGTYADDGEPQPAVEAYALAARAWWDVLFAIRSEFDELSKSGRPVGADEMAKMDRAFKSALWRNEPGRLDVVAPSGAVRYAVIACEDPRHPFV